MEDGDSINQLYHQLFGQDAMYIDDIEQINRINWGNNSYILIATINGKTIGTIQCTVYQLMPYFIVDKLCCFRE